MYTSLPIMYHKISFNSREQMMKKEKKEKKEKKVILKSEKVRRRERFIKILRFALLIMALLLICIYLILRMFFNQGAFTVVLDRNLAKDTGIVLVENLNDTNYKMLLSAQEAVSMDNISESWLPNNLDNLGGGSHNGTNYFAYTFYIKNAGVDTVRLLLFYSCRLSYKKCG